MPNRRVPAPDLPVPFGYKCGWFAVHSTDSDAIMHAFGLQQPKPSTWSAGIAAAYKNKVFLTPPVKEWSLLVALHWLSLLDREPGKVVGLALRVLSKQLGEVQMFVTYRVPEYHLWALGRAGRLLRGYCYIGEIIETVWNEGRPTAVEQQVGPFDEDNWRDEESVMKVAARWSINPCELDQLITEPGLGVLCTPPATLPA